MRGTHAMTRILAVAALALLAGCGGSHISFLDPQRPVAAQQRTHFLIILGAMMIIVLPVIVLTPWLAWPSDLIAVQIRHL